MTCGSFLNLCKIMECDKEHAYNVIYLGRINNQFVKKKLSQDKKSTFKIFRSK